MICIYKCTNCKHNRHVKIDGWIPSCDAFPDGMPLDFQPGKIQDMQECNNGIGYEPIDINFKI